MSSEHLYTFSSGKDYVNFIVKDVARPEEPEGDNVDRRTTPRMPWHDIALMVQGSLHLKILSFH